MISYNHENFIHEAIQGVLGQKCDFQIELIIGEDCSTDKTKSICKIYESKYPEIVKLLHSESNLGMIPNFIRTINACAGKYIALCEGDDYWTDPYKLQKQVDFLEKNPDFSICFHKVKVLKGKKLHRDTITRVPKIVSTFEDLIIENYIHTLSCVAVNRRSEDLFNLLQDSPVGDYLFHLHHAKFGKIYYFNQAMGVYRISGSGIWSNLTGIQMKEKGLIILNKILEICGEKHAGLISNRIYSFYISIIKHYEEARDTKKLDYYIKHRRKFGINEDTLIEQMASLLNNNYPGILKYVNFQFRKKILKK